MPTTKAFQRVSDGGIDNVEMDSYNKDQNGNITNFYVGETHYFLRKHKTSFIPDVLGGLSGGATGAQFRAPKGPTPMKLGAALGSILGLIGAEVSKHIYEHIKANPNQKITWCYATDKGREVYWGPVSA